MKIPGRELAIALVWLAAVGGAFAAFYFLAGPGARRAPQTRREKTTPPGAEKAPPPEPEERPLDARAEPRRIFADGFEGEGSEGWEAFGGSKTITLARADGLLRVKGASGSLDWDTAGLRTRAYELDRFSASVEFKLVSNEGTGTKMFFLCAEDPGNEEARAWVYFHPTRGVRENPGFAAMKEGGSARGTGAPDGGKAFHTLRLTCARGKLAAYEMRFKKVRFALGLKSPAEGERVEGIFDSFRLLDGPDRSFEP